MPVVIFRSTVPVTVETKGKVISAHSRSKVTGSRARDSSHHESHLNAEVKGKNLIYSYDFLKIQTYTAASKLKKLGLLIKQIKLLTLHTYTKRKKLSTGEPRFFKLSNIILENKPYILTILLKTYSDFD